MPCARANSGQPRLSSSGHTVPSGGPWHVWTGCPIRSSAAWSNSPSAPGGTSRSTTPSRPSRGSTMSCLLSLGPTRAREAEQRLQRALDATGNDPDVGRGVVVAGDGEVEPPVVRQDGDPDADTGADGDIRQVL